MTKVNVRLFGRMASKIGTEVSLDLPVGSTIDDLFLQLTSHDPDLEQILWRSKTELSPQLLILRNDHPIFGGLDTPLTDKDSISIDSFSILEVVGGG